MNRWAHVTSELTRDQHIAVSTTLQLTIDNQMSVLYGMDENDHGACMVKANPVFFPLSPHELPIDRYHDFISAYDGTCLAWMAAHRESVVENGIDEEDHVVCRELAMYLLNGMSTYCKATTEDEYEYQLIGV